MLIAAEHPAVPSEVRDRVAYGVVSMAMHNVFMNDIATSAAHTEAARTAAQWLVDTL